MKSTSDNASLSPPMRASPTGFTKPVNHLPISRPTSSTWEKPERARTSHACEPCRERKTKCDGDRPSCRRCLHTGTSCHYGYGKGWRKRKTAEDLTATSRRLARYETLLSQIIPLVSNEVRVLIEDARDLDTATSNGSETTEPEPNYHPPSLPGIKSESNSSSGSRPLLPFPIPSTLAPTVSRSSNSSGTYDSVTPSSVPPLTPTPAPQGTISPDTSSLTRLPSITPDGVLIEEGSPPRSQLPNDPKITTATGQDRLVALPTSPNNTRSSGDALRNPFSVG
ncbi:hypothetical protein B0A52_01258 [Exophiala mesophila]|uniref:Zn(2)-C6 fungal-type domain-containing protein n=1 Tax=Exophiala mesophila TaxID=212818 RepID=A0A438NGX4_EXOME|nr:hypothetical protein B0A52_01258 [Exophiala mesophila]